MKQAIGVVHGKALGFWVKLPADLTISADSSRFVGKDNNGNFILVDGDTGLPVVGWVDMPEENAYDAGKDLFATLNPSYTYKQGQQIFITDDETNYYRVPVVEGSLDDVKIGELYILLVINGKQGISTISDEANDTNKVVKVVDIETQHVIVKLV